MKFVAALMVGAAFVGSAYGAGGTSHAVNSLTSGLIHWWKFNGSGMDSVGESNIVPVGPVNYVQAVMGEGIELNGSSNGMNIPPNREMQFQGSFTLSAWTLLKVRPSGKMWSSLIFDGDDRPGLDPYALQVGPNGNMVFEITGRDDSASLEAPFPLNKFVLVTAVYDKDLGVQSLYFDGKLVGQNLGKRGLTPVVPLVDNANAGIGIGTNNEFQKSIYNFGWNGIINDLRVYSRALSPADAMALYKLGVKTAKQGGLDLIHQ